MDPLVWKQMILLLIPAIGRLMKAIPLINNQVIPLLLGAFLTVKNYWIMADLPMELVPETISWMPGNTEYQLAGLFGLFGKHILAVGWGMAESVIAGRVQRSFKYRDRFKAVEAGTHTMKTAKAVDRWWV